MKDTISVQDIIDKHSSVAFDETAIEKIDYMAVDNFFKFLNKHTYHKILFVIILKGAKHFANSFLSKIGSELGKRRIVSRTTEIRIKSYGKNTSSGVPEIEGQVPDNLSDYDAVFVLEDIMDKGKTAEDLQRLFGDYVLVCRIDKQINREVIPDSVIILSGTTILDPIEKDYFYFGAGFDLNDEDQYRELPKIYRIKKTVVNELFA